MFNKNYIDFKGFILNIRLLKKFLLYCDPT